MSYTKSSAKVIAIIGNIGSGKTTLVDNLSKEHANSFPLYEPVEEWRKHGILDAFYKDQQKLSGLFQMYVFSSRLKEVLRAMKQDYSLIFLDAHVENDRWVFKEVLRSEGCIDDIQNTIYERTFENWQELVPGWQDTCFIYLNTPVQQCLEQLRKRNRGEEVNIKIEYLQKLKDNFDILFKKLQAQYDHVVEINGNQTEQELVKQANHYLHKWGVCHDNHHHQENGNLEHTTTK